MINQIIKDIVGAGLLVASGVKKYGWYCMMILSGVGMLNIVSSIGVELVLLVSFIIVLVIMRRMLSDVLVVSFVEESIERLSKVIRVIKEGIALLEIKVYRKEMGKAKLSTYFFLLCLMCFSDQHL